MLVPRIGETIQPAWERTATAVAVRLQPAVEQTAALSRAAISLVAFALRPAALVAMVFGIWRLGIDLGWTQDFFISQGLFSHWQVWFGLAMSMIAAASFLTRVAGADNE